MSRNRIIKPEFCSSLTLSSISLESNLLFALLWTHCDDFGTILNNNRQILGNCFPHRSEITEKHIDKWKSELVNQKLICPVIYNNKEILIMRSWEEHQKVPNISKRNNIDNDMEIPEIKVKIQELINHYLESNFGLIRDKLESNSPMNNDNDNVNDNENDKRPTLPDDKIIEDYFFEVISKQLKILNQTIENLDRDKCLIDFDKCLNYCKNAVKTTKKKSYNWKNQVNGWVNITKYRNYQKQPESDCPKSWQELLSRVKPATYNYLQHQSQIGRLENKTLQEIWNIAKAKDGNISA